MEIKRNREGKSKEKRLKTGLEGKTVMISGASRNIGKQTAILMAEEGANLVLCTQKSIEPLQETAHELEELGANVIAELCDVTNQDQVNKFVNKAADKFGSVEEVGAFVLAERAAKREELQNVLTTALKVDSDTKMGIISDIKQELRKVNALKLNYTTRVGDYTQNFKNN